MVHILALDIKLSLDDCGTKSQYFQECYFWLSKEILVCVTEQHYVSIFFTRLWSVHKPLLFDTKNPGISGFSIRMRMRINSKPNG